MIELIKVTLLWCIFWLLCIGVLCIGCAPEEQRPVVLGDAYQVTTEVWVDVVHVGSGRAGRIRMPVDCVFHVVTENGDEDEHDVRDNAEPVSPREMAHR